MAHIIGDIFKNYIIIIEMKKLIISDQELTEPVRVPKEPQGSEEHTLRNAALEPGKWTAVLRSECSVKFPRPAYPVQPTTRSAKTVMTSHHVYTSGTSRVLTVASLQWLKIDTLIPAPVSVKTA